MSPNRVGRIESEGMAKREDEAMKTGPTYFPGKWRGSNALCGLFLTLTLGGVFSQGLTASDPARTMGGKSLFEDFATLDRNRWQISNGWSSGSDLGCVWSASNVKLIGRMMSLVLNNRRSGGKDFSCGEVQSREAYGYGTYEVRMRPAVGPGIVSAFLSYTGLAQGTAQERWISIQLPGRELKALHLNFSASGGPTLRHNVNLKFDPSEAMNDYAFQWTPKSVRWFVNGELVHTMDISSAPRDASRPGKIIVSLHNNIGEAQSAWLGRFEYDGQPLLTSYEYIAFTELGAPCQFPTSVVCKQPKP
jgi:endo-1,3-1,4-beta-glycanase ExoK